MLNAAVKGSKDFLSILDMDAGDLERALELAARLKADRPLGAQAPTATALSGRYVAMLFEKSSLRTRTTFEVGVRELGGRAIGLQPDVALGQREPVADIARSLERWVDAVVVRTFSQRTTRGVRRQRATSSCHQRADRRRASVPDHGRLPVAAGTLGQPCAAGRSRLSATATTWRRRSPTRAAMLGLNLHVASPDGYQLPDGVVQRADTGRAPRCPAAAVQRPGGRRRGGGRRLHGHLDVDGKRGGGAMFGGRRSPRIR